MRLFTALRIPANVHPALAAAQSALRVSLPDDVAWTAPDNFHVTLQFLGEVPDSRVPALRSSLASVRVEPFTLALQQLGTLPFAGSARIIVAEVSGQLDRLHRLFSTIEQATRPLGFLPEERAWHPHVTLGRLRHAGDVRVPIASVPFEPSEPFVIAGFELIHSTLAPGGAHYRTLASFPLVA